MLLLRRSGSVLSHNASQWEIDCQSRTSSRDGSDSAMAQQQPLPASKMPQSLLQNEDDVSNKVFFLFESILNVHFFIAAGKK